MLVGSAKSRGSKPKQTPAAGIPAAGDAAHVVGVAASGGSRAVLYLVFTLSGLVGLIYEATWTRYLQLFLGHAAYAQVLVLALFMGGMGGGALLAGRISPRISPLAAYAAIEGALGLYALAFHPLFVWTTKFAYATLLPGTLESFTGQVEQWTLAGALILPPSLLLGMTFPLMSAAILRLGAPQPGRVFAMLYFTNSGGAVIGVLLAGFWFIESDGLQATMRIAGAGNLAVTAIALLVSWQRVQPQPALQRKERSQGGGRWMLAIAFLTAVSSFLYEIGWLRMLALVQGSSTHAFETMLSAFILGLALGSLWIRFRITRYKSPLAVLARVQILMGLAALASLSAYPLAFEAVEAALPWLRSQPHGYAGYNVLGYLLSAAIMVPASFFAGTTLPLLTHILYERGRGESEIGAVYGWNTLGGIVGIALGGLLLMPLIGLKNMIVLGSAIDIAIGAALVAWLVRRRALAAQRAAIVLCGFAGIAVLAGLLLFQFDPMRLASGVFRSGKARLPDTSKVLFYADGRTASVSVEQQGDQSVSITTNGKTDARIQMAKVRGVEGVFPGPDEYTMTLLAALPLAYAPKAAQAAIIGHGTGLSTHVLLGSPAIQHVDVIEIEPEMIRAARAFLPRVERAYTDRRAQIHIEDARAFFARTPRKYDIIMSEPSNPWVSGVASLYTPEFYRQARASLARGGLFVQWFHLYEIDRPMVRSVMSALGSVFSDYVMYGSNDSDVVIVATASGSMPPMSEALFDWPGTKSELAYLDIRTLSQLNGFRVANRRAYAPLLERGRVNSDYFPVLEFGAARTRFTGNDDSILIRMYRDPVPVLEILSGFSPPLPIPDSKAARTWITRFRDISVANLIGLALAEGPGSSAEPALPEHERESVAIFRNPPRGDSEEEWKKWLSALFDLARPMTPSGNWLSLDARLRSAGMTAELRRAPKQVQDKVAFMTAVGRRDLDRIRQLGRDLLAGSIDKDDPGFHAYALVATVTACLASTPDQACRSVIGMLDKVQRESQIIEVLRAHKRLLS